MKDAVALYIELDEIKRKMNSHKTWDDECRKLKDKELSIISLLDRIDNERGGVEGIDFVYFGSTKCWVVNNEND